MLSKDVENYMMNDEFLVLSLLYLTKFALDVMIFKVLGGGNTKELTASLFYIRLSFDFCVILFALVYMLYKRRLGLGQAAHFTIPLLIVEPLIYFWSVRPANQRVSFKEVGGNYHKKASHKKPLIYEV